MNQRIQLPLHFYRSRLKMSGILVLFIGMYCAPIDAFFRFHHLSIFDKSMMFLLFVIGLGGSFVAILALVRRKPLLSIDQQGIQVTWLKSYQVDFTEIKNIVLRRWVMQGGFVIWNIDVYLKSGKTKSIINSCLYLNGQKYNEKEIFNVLYAFYQGQNPRYIQRVKMTFWDRIDKSSVYFGIILLIAAIALGLIWRHFS